MRKLGLLNIVLVLLAISCKKEITTTTVPNGGHNHNHTHVEIETKGFPVMPIPEDNETTLEGIELGRKLFYDPILSGDNTQSCSSCHQQKNAFSDPDRFSTGIDGKQGNRNAPGIINAGWQTGYFWDGRAKTLEEQALGPVPNPIEMHQSWETVVVELQNHGEYPTLFDKAFPGESITKENVAKAIAQFERTLISNNSKYDSVNLGLTNYTQEEAAGFNIFFSETGECFHCHGTVLLTDNESHNNGLQENIKDIGLEEVTGKASDKAKFRSPTLRNIEFTAPYMHDGRYTTLEQVINFYSDSTRNSATLDPLMKVGGYKLTQKQKDQLLAFLKTLSDKEFITNPDFSKPN